MTAFPTRLTGSPVRRPRIIAPKTTLLEFVQITFTVGLQCNKGSESTPISRFQLKNFSNPFCLSFLLGECGHSSCGYMQFDLQLFVLVSIPAAFFPKGPRASSETAGNVSFCLQVCPFPLSPFLFFHIPKNEQSETKTWHGQRQCDTFPTFLHLGICFTCFTWFMSSEGKCELSGIENLERL